MDIKAKPISQLFWGRFSDPKLWTPCRRAGLCHICTPTVEQILNLLLWGLKNVLGSMFSWLKWSNLWSENTDLHTVSSIVRLGSCVLGFTACPCHVMCSDQHINMIVVDVSWACRSTISYRAERGCLSWKSSCYRLTEIRGMNSIM